jgi:hypothetical protein
VGSGSNDRSMPRFIHFKTPGFMSMFDVGGRDGVWINPDQVTSLERIAADSTRIYLADGRSHAVDGAVEDVIETLTR